MPLPLLSCISVLAHHCAVPKAQLCRSPAVHSILSQEEVGSLKRKKYFLNPLLAPKRSRIKLPMQCNSTTLQQTSVRDKKSPGRCRELRTTVALIYSWSDTSCPWIPEVACDNKCGPHMLTSIFYLILQHSHLVTAGMNINTPVMNICCLSVYIY